MPRLSGQDYKQWVAAFKDAFANRSDLAFVVRTASNRDLDMITTAGSVEEDIEVLIRKADHQGWLRSLLEEALERQPDRLLLKQLSAEFAVMTVIEPDDPFAAMRIFGDPMFDRADLRAKLRVLQTDGAAPVLLVDGKPLTGKTWSRRLISYAVNKLEGVTHVPVDVTELEGKVVNAAALGELIAEEAGFEGPPPANEEQDAQWIRQYCAWLGRRAKNAGGHWWIVLDHLQKVPLHQSAKDLVHAMGKEIPLTMPMIRLIVLSYDDPSDLAIGVGRIDCENIPSMTLEEIEKHLVSFLSAEYLARDHAAGRELDQGELQRRVATSASAVLGGIDDSSPERLTQMVDALRAELSRS
jgi:hypothetical protein